MPREFDLLGDPIPENFGKPGANGHTVTAKNINKVRMLVVAKWTSKMIADELGVSVPTLNKHYFQNTSIKRARQVCLAEVRGRLMMQLDAAAEKGNVGAIKELKSICDIAEIADLAAEKVTPKKQPKLGKKEQRRRDARDLDAGDEGGVAGFLPNYGVRPS